MLELLSWFKSSVWSPNTNLQGPDAWTLSFHLPRGEIQSTGNFPTGGIFSWESCKCRRHLQIWPNLYPWGSRYIVETFRSLYLCMRIIWRLLITNATWSILTSIDFLVHSRLAPQPPALILNQCMLGEVRKCGNVPTRISLVAKHTTVPQRSFERSLNY